MDRNRVRLVLCPLRDPFAMNGNMGTFSSKGSTISSDEGSICDMVVVDR
jgi:hypothetical protein